jgi:hypothetical protein
MVDGAVVDTATTVGTDVMTTAEDSPAINAMKSVNDTTAANDDPGAITIGAVDETVNVAIDVPAATINFHINC